MVRILCALGIVLPYEGCNLITQSFFIAGVVQQNLVGDTDYLLGIAIEQVFADILRQRVDNVVADFALEVIEPVERLVLEDLSPIDYCVEALEVVEGVYAVTLNHVETNGVVATDVAAKAQHILIADIADFNLVHALEYLAQLQYGDTAQTAYVLTVAVAPNGIADIAAGDARITFCGIEQQQHEQLLQLGREQLRYVFAVLVEHAEVAEQHY